MNLSEELREAVSRSDKGFSLKQKPGEDYWFVMVGGKKIGAVSKDDDGKFDGKKNSAAEGEDYKQGFATKDDAASWIAGGSKH